MCMVPHGTLVGVRAERPARYATGDLWRQFRKMTRLPRQFADGQASLLRAAAIGTAVLAVYIAAAEVGFRVALVAEQVTTVWAPTGIAIATLLIWGPRFWPAIWLGAFAVNAATSAPLWTAFVLATGNTLEAIVATHVLRRVPRFDFKIGRASCRERV